MRYCKDGFENGVQNDACLPACESVLPHFDGEAKKSEPRLMMSCSSSCLNYRNNSLFQCKLVHPCLCIAGFVVHTYSKYEIYDVCALYLKYEIYDASSRASLGTSNFIYQNDSAV